jgi:hypothetical protein
MNCGTVQLNLSGRVAAGCGIPCYLPCIHARDYRCTLVANHAAAGDVGNCPGYAPAARPAVPEGRT